MTKKRELTILEEVTRIYQNCAARQAAYHRRKWLMLIVAWFLVSLAIILEAFQIASGVVTCTIATVGGCLVGLAVWFASAARQIPLLTRYTTLREEDVRTRLLELKEA